mgnify:CR=1 FL=1
MDKSTKLILIFIPFFLIGLGIEKYSGKIKSIRCQTTCSNDKSYKTDAEKNECYCHCYYIDNSEEKCNEYGEDENKWE